MSETRQAEGGLASLLDRIGRCRRCRDEPLGRPLPHEPRPVLRVGPTARLAVCGQAPGTRVHASGMPFTDPSGERLRAWMGVTKEEFYDVRRVAIVPMGFCFPGHDAKGGDLPPRRECAALWHHQVFAGLRRLELVLLVGHHAQRWHLGPAARGLTDTVRDWRAVMAASERPRYLPLPHPSWRNNGWIRSHPWFEDELLPALRREVRSALQG
ncbi:MAG: uracil-DNA glycosylase family protein [Hyphomicrobiaceae bacterium]|nr:uracil-DNA glycosylase family protein [Hyphomicrobiaceae bacterium]